MEKSNKKIVRLTESKIREMVSESVYAVLESMVSPQSYDQIVDELTKNIHDAEMEQYEKTGEIYGRDAIDSHYFRYEVMEDNVNEIAEMYGISYDEAVQAFQEAWNRAHDMLER